VLEAAMVKRSLNLTIKRNKGKWLFFKWQYSYYERLSNKRIVLWFKLQNKADVLPNCTWIGSSHLFTCVHIFKFVGWFASALTHRCTGISQGKGTKPWFLSSLAHNTQTELHSVCCG
jgi:hypothetical protein